MRSLLALFFVLATGSAQAAELKLTNWGNYTNPALLEKFTAETGIEVTVKPFISNDWMLDEIRAGGHGQDLAVPSGAMVATMIAEGPWKKGTAASTFNEREFQVCITARLVEDGARAERRAGAIERVPLQSHVGARAREQPRARAAREERRDLAASGDPAAAVDELAERLAQGHLVHAGPFDAATDVHDEDRRCARSRCYGGGEIDDARQ